MSLTTAMNSAFSGLRATQVGIDLVSQNVANAGSVGYTRRTLSVEQQVAGGRTIGVQAGATQRMLDAMVQRQLRLEQAGASYTSVRARAASSLAAMFDSPGGAGSLATLVNNFSQSLQALANNPSAYTNRAGVLSAASDLAGSLNGLAGQVQAMRQSTEEAIGANVKKADGLLQQIATLNAKVVADPGSAALQDQRDGLIDQLSTLLDVKVTTQPSGSVAISTTGGLQLFDGLTATRLSFDAQSLGPGASYDPDPSKRGVGTITATDGSGNRRDVLASGLIRSGEIAAQIELRDVTLPRAAAQLDELAAGLAASLSDKTVAGTAATSGAATGFDIDLAALAAGNTLTVSVRDPGGATRTLTFVKAGSAAAAAAATSADGATVGIDFSGGFGSVASQIGAALGAGYAVSNPAGTTIRILDDGGAGTTDVVSASAQATVTGLASGSPELPLFVDGSGNLPFTGSYEAGSQRAGFAGRIAINPSVRADIASLVAYGPSTPAGDATRPLFLLDRLSGASRTFSGAAGIGGSSSAYTGTVTDFAQRIIETQAADATSSATLDEGQSVVLANIQARYAEDAGVNIDSELTQLIQLQTAYGANARMISAAKEMLDMLLRIGA